MARSKRGRRFPIVFPFGGRVDRTGFNAQPFLTTRDALNVRARDPLTGRIRGAQRAGTSKLFSTQLFASGGFKAICSLSHDNQKVSYARRGTPTQDWETSVPSGAQGRDLDVDRQSNVYVLDGDASVVKYNSAGKQIWKVALPTEDDSHLARGIHVDDVDCVYASISSGGDQEEAAIWKYGQLEDDKTELVWTIKPGRYIEQIKRQDNLLYTLQNDHFTARSFVVTYTDIDSAVPTMVRETKVGYPANGLDIADDGSFYVASPHDASSATATSNTAGSFIRGVHPQFDLYYPSSQDWTPKNLDNWEERIWTWLEADKIEPADIQDGKVEDGKEIQVWRDSGLGGRNAFKCTATLPGIPSQPTKGPTLSSTSLNGLPTLRFDGDSGLWFPPIGDGYASQAEFNKGLFPMFTLPVTAAGDNNGSWCIFIVCKPDTSATAPGILVSMNRGGSNQWSIKANENSAVVTTAGTLRVEGNPDPLNLGAGTAGQPLEFAWDTASEGTGACIITVQCDNATNPTPFAQTTQSLLRVNGQPVDRWSSASMNGNHVTAGGVIGFGTNTTGEILLGDIAEILVLRRADLRATTGDKGYVLEHQTFPDIGAAAQSENEMTQVEGYLAHKWGVQHLLDRETADAANWPHPYGLTDSTGFNDSVASPPDADTGSPSDLATTTMNFAMVTKYNNAGLFVWSYNWITAAAAAEADVDRGGAGYAVKVARLEDEDDVRVWTAGQIGNQFTGVNGDTSVRQIIDKGSTFSIASVDGAWVNDDTLYPTYFWIRMDVDKFGQLYYPWTANVSATFKVYELAGAAGKGVEAATYLLPSNKADFAVHHDPAIPEYGVGQTINMAESVYHLSLIQTTGEVAHKTSLVVVTSTTGSARTIVNLAAGAGDIKTFTVGGVIVTPSGGSGALDSTSEFTQCIPMVGEAVFLDGLTYKVYRAAENDVTTLEATSSGEIPKRAKLGAFWRNRLVLANFPGNPGGWAMSAMGDIRNWDVLPPVITSTAAILGSLSRSQETPAIVTGLIPASEDLLLIGAYDSIWRMTGDPMDGGQLDRLSDSIGMAFGRAWTKDPEGRIFFFGLNPPGLYTLSASGGVENVTQGTLEETDFSAIDFEVYNVSLYWNPEDRGIHIFLEQRNTASASPDRHWFWEEKSAEFTPRPPLWPDKFEAEGHQPLAAASLEGDTSDDRVFVIGGEDGYLRFWDKNALNDDSSLIDSFVVVSIARQTSGVEMFMSELKFFLASDQDGARVEYYASDNADVLGNLQHTVMVRPGQTDVLRRTIRGENIHLLIGNAHPEERWAYENGAALITGAQAQRRT